MGVDGGRVHLESVAQWREWLEANHAVADSVWLVTWKASSGKPSIGYDESVVEALAFGWVDSVGKAVDAERTSLWFARRKSSSPWSLTNKARVARLETDGRMAPAGAAAVEAAKINGMWTILDDAQNLVVADDLAVALGALDGARELWDELPASARRMALERIALAKRPATRARRVDEVARRTAAGERPG